MPKPLQIREVPEDVLRVLRVRVAEEGTSLSAYALRVLADHAARPSIREVMSRPRGGWTRAAREDVLAAVREGREQQDRKALDAARRDRGR